MDDETLNLLKTVCAAGCASPGFNEQTNARLEDLLQAGLLEGETDLLQRPTSKPPRRSYRPTEQARVLLRAIGAA